MGRRNRDTVSLKTLSPVWEHATERDLTCPVLLPEEQGVGAPHQAPQPLGSVLERQDPKLFGLENQWG